MNLPIPGDGLYEMWGLRLVIDMFLGGAGAGAFFLAIVASFAFGWVATSSIRKIAGVFAVAAMAVSLLLLLSELTQPGRGILPFFSGEVSAPIMWGSWIQLLFLLVAAAFSISALGWARFGDPFTKALGVIGAVLGLAVIIYHGVYLADYATRVFWSAGGILMLFPVISLATGAAVLVIGLAVARDKGSVAAVRGIALFMTWSAIAMLVGAGLYIYQLAAGGSDGEAAARLITTGEFALATWIAVFTLGVIAVIALYLSVRRTGDVSANDGGAATFSLTMPALAAALVLVAGFTLRYVIVIGGQIASQLPLT